MRLIAVLSVIVGIPALFIFLHVENRTNSNATIPSVVSIPYYAEEHVEKCFFWVTEDGKTSIPLVDPIYEK